MSSGMLAIALAGALAARAADAAQAPLPDRTPSASAGTVSYRIEARLLDEPGGSPHLIEASAQVTWRNQTPASTDELWWHVYNNAWASRKSVWMREARRFGDHRSPRSWGGTAVSGVRLLDRGEAEASEWISAGGSELAWEWVPQPGAPEDRTVLRMQLPEPVPPDGRITVRFDFLTDLPPAFRRSGVGSGGYVHAVQWYPKLGVFEERDGAHVWNCEPYHYLTEFYSDYGDYRVRLTLPGRYADEEGDKLLATGSKQGGPAGNEDGSLSWELVARDVHDFAWTADPQALYFTRRFDPSRYPWTDPEEERAVAGALGRSVESVRPSADWDITMHLLLQPEHAGYEERYFDALAKSVYWFGLWYGPYPYPTISLVDPAADARATGGMEYPRLITGGVDLHRPPRSFRPEGVTVHEFGHQYWYGLVGNDEFHHAWMDEGFCTFSTNRVLARAWEEPPLEIRDILGRGRPGRPPFELPPLEEDDPRTWLLQERAQIPAIGGFEGLDWGLREGSELLRTLASWPSLTDLPRVERDPVWHQRFAHRYPFSDPIATPTHALLENEMRRLNAYYRPAMTLETIARLCGPVRWRRLIRSWHEEQRFRHPRPADFEATLANHGAGATLQADDGGAVEIDWTSFWRQAYHGNARLDFAVQRVAQPRAVVDPRALPEPGEDFEALEAEAEIPAEPRWDVLVEVERRAGFRTPVEIDLVWEDGGRERHVWDGRDWWWRLEVPDSPRRLSEVIVDPERRYLLDQNRLNNSRRAEPRQERSESFGLRVWLWAAHILHWYGGVG